MIRQIMERPSVAAQPKPIAATAWLTRAISADETSSAATISAAPIRST